MLNKRVEVLFEPDEYDRLVAVARQERKSVGRLLREAAAKKYLVPPARRRQAALKKLLAQTDDLPPWEEIKFVLTRRFEPDHS